MEIVGTIVSTDHSPSTTEFAFVVETSNIKKGQYVQTHLHDAIIFGFISEIYTYNRYFEHAESVAEYEKIAPMSENFPISNWNYSLAEVKIVGSYLNEKFLRVNFPPKPGEKVYLADEKLLSTFLGLKDNGIYIGKLQHHNIDAKIDLSRLFQKHLAILAMSGAGKSHLSTVIIEELLERKKENGRIAVVVIDIHGEYSGFIESKYSPQTTIIDVGAKKGGFKYPLRKISVEMFEEWLPMLTTPQTSILSNALKDLKERSEKEQTSFSLNDLINYLSSSLLKNKKDAASVNVLIRNLNILKKMHFISKNKENPALVDVVKPGHLLILDFSNVDSLQKKQIIVSLVARKLFNLRKKGKIPPFLFIVEEAHNFAREKAEESKAISRSIIETIAREGRKFGASLCLISQRPVNLSATALAQCNTHIILRITNPNDLEHIQQSSEWIDARIAKMISSLHVGECIIVGEATNAPVFVDVRNIKIKKKEKGKSLELLAKEYEEEREKEQEDTEVYFD